MDWRGTTYRDRTGGPATPLVAVLLAALSMGLATLDAPAGADDIGIDTIEPALADSTLVCTVRLHGLPDAASRETLESGLPSALVVAFSILDERGREEQISRIDVRIEPDLWEEVLVMRTPLSEWRVSSIEEVAAQLEELGPLPVISMAHPLVAECVAGEARLRLRARLAVHPLAPTEFERVSEVFGGQGESSDPNRREVSVGLGSLFRYFMRGQPDEDWVAQGESTPFSCTVLDDVP
jgi:hypothetical protein